MVVVVVIIIAAAWRKLIVSLQLCWHHDESIHQQCSCWVLGIGPNDQHLDEANDRRDNPWRDDRDRDDHGHHSMRRHHCRHRPGFDQPKTIYEFSDTSLFAQDLYSSTHPIIFIIGDHDKQFTTHATGQTLWYQHMLRPATAAEIEFQFFGATLGWAINLQVAEGTFKWNGDTGLC